jgi:periplasmic protein TonB
MKLNPSSWCFLLAITLIHLGGIAYAVMKQDETKQEIITPSIQGVLVFAEKTPEKIEQPLPPPPEPEPKPKPTPKTKPKPIPKAEPSEHAIKVDEAQTPVLEKAVESKPVENQTEPLVLPSAEATGLNNPAPAYPAMSRKLKEEGIVLLKILVTKEGRVAEIEIKSSSGFKRLDFVAVKAVKHWKFNPATQAGEAIDYWYELPIEFNLKKKSD